MWTTFYDTHSGGSQKLQWSIIYVEMPESEARAWFESTFDRDPDNVTCDCCGDDYSVSEYDSLEEATDYYRHELSIGDYARQSVLIVPRFGGDKALRDLAAWKIEKVIDEC